MVRTNARSPSVKRAQFPVRVASKCPSNSQTRNVTVAVPVMRWAVVVLCLASPSALLASTLYPSAIRPTERVALVRGDEASWAADPAALPAGEVVLAWWQGHGLWLRFYNSEGVPVGPARLVSDSLSRATSRPLLVSSQRGGLWASWRELDPSTGEQHLVVEEQRSGDRLVVAYSEPGLDTLLEPDAGAICPSGFWALAWRRGGEGSCDRFLTVFDDSGRVRAQVRLGACVHPAVRRDIGSTAVACGAGDRILALWEEGDSVKGALLNVRGERVAPDLAIASAKAPAVIWTGNSYGGAWIDRMDGNVELAVLDTEGRVDRSIRLGRPIGPRPALEARVKLTGSGDLLLVSWPSSTSDHQSGAALGQLVHWDRLLPLETAFRLYEDWTRIVGLVGVNDRSIYLAWREKDRETHGWTQLGRSLELDNLDLVPLTPQEVQCERDQTREALRNQSTLEGPPAASGEELHDSPSGSTGGSSLAVRTPISSGFCGPPPGELDKQRLSLLASALHAEGPADRYEMAIFRDSGIDTYRVVLELFDSHNHSMGLLEGWIRYRYRADGTLAEIEGQPLFAAEQHNPLEAGCVHRVKLRNTAVSIVASGIEASGSLIEWSVPCWDSG